MRILSLSVMKWDEENPTFLSSVYDLSFINFIKRHFFKEALNFGIRTAVARVKQGEKTVVHLEDADDAVCCVVVDKQNIACAVVADKEYPQKVCFTIIAEIYREFYQAHNMMQIGQITKDSSLTIPKFDQMITKYQDPKEADKLVKLEATLQEVQEICHKNLQDLMRRGENLDNLINKSKDMSAVSTDFYKKARQANKKCCILI